MLSSEELEYSAKASDWMTRLRRINFQHSRRQIRRVGQLKQSRAQNACAAIFLDVYINTDS